MGRETLGEVRGTLEEIRDGSGDNPRGARRVGGPSGRSGQVGGPSGRSGTGRRTLPEDQHGSGDPTKGP